MISKKFFIFFCLIPGINDAKMLEQMGDALTNLQIKFRNSDVGDRMLMRSALEELLRDYNTYQLRLLYESGYKYYERMGKAKIDKNLTVSAIRKVGEFFYMENKQHKIVRTKDFKVFEEIKISRPVSMTIDRLGE